MSKSESRKTEKQVLVRMTAEEFERLEKALAKAMAEAPSFATSSVSRFVLQAALEASERVLRGKGR